MTRTKTDAFEALIEGYKHFRKQYLDKEYKAYRKWAANEQNPKVMMISCSDSRVNPAIITHSGLGEIFMVNNVANLVPPYKEGKNTHHSTSAAIEFAVNHLNVEHIIVMGHSKCGGIRALVEGNASTSKDYSFILPWMDIAAEARDIVKQNNPSLSIAEQAKCCEKEALLVSLKNLATFPWVKSAMAENSLEIHAWYFNIEDGMIQEYEEESNKFTEI